MAPPDAPLCHDRLKEAFLSVRAMKSARNVRKQLEQEVRKAGLDPTLTATDVDCIARAFTAGMTKAFT